MTVHQARVIAFAAGLIGISALVPSTRLHAQQTHDELRALAEQGDAEAQYDLGVMVRPWRRCLAGLRGGGPVVSSRGRPGVRCRAVQSRVHVCRRRRRLARRCRGRPMVSAGGRPGVRRGAVRPRGDVSRRRRSPARRCRGRSVVPPRRRPGVWSGRRTTLGWMYAEGRGVPQDDAEAARCYRLAADQGHATGQYNLGVMYVNGRGVPQDYVEAHMWYNLAAAQSSGEDRDGRVKARDALAEEMTSEQLAEAQRRVKPIFS